MKQQQVQTNSIMNLTNIKIRNRVVSKPVVMQQNNPEPFQICQMVSQLKQKLNPETRSKVLIKLINLCYNNKANQFFLCNNLQIPYCEGPVSLTGVPLSFKTKANHILTLFKYLQKVKQSYVSWMIYKDQQLGVFNLKLFTQYQFQDIGQLLVDEEILVGIFIGQKYFPKARTHSTKSVIQKVQHSNSKTSKQSLLKKSSKQKSNKSLKSVSMKQKKHRQELSMKNLQHTYTHKKHSEVEEKKNSSFKSTLSYKKYEGYGKDTKNKIVHLANSFNNAH